MKIAGKLYTIFLGRKSRPPTFFRDDITTWIALIAAQLSVQQSVGLWITFSFSPFFFKAVSTNSLVETPIISTPVSRNSFDKVYKLNCQVCMPHFYKKKKQSFGFLKMPKKSQVIKHNN